VNPTDRPAAAHVHYWKRLGCMGARDERCHPEPGMCACFDGAWGCACGERTRTDPAAATPRERRPRNDLVIDDPKVLRRMLEELDSSFWYWREAAYRAGLDMEAHDRELTRIYENLSLMKHEEDRG